MKVKELIEELKKYDGELEVYCDVRDSVLYYGGEDVNDGIEDQYIEGVELGYQVNWDGPNEPCVVLK